MRYFCVQKKVPKTDEKRNTARVRESSTRAKNKQKRNGKDFDLELNLALFK